MDVNIKNLDPAVISRLAEQAAAEGMSQQEWLRQTLRRTAARLSPAELVARRAELTPMTDEEFTTLRRKVSARRAGRVDRLNASDRRR
jgi:hypothetical protein